jgi:hypothetical protein
MLSSDSLETGTGSSNSVRSANESLRFGPAEVGHNAVPEVLGDTSAEALDRLRRCPMIAGDNLPPLFRVEMASYLGWADQIAEKHRQMSPLAG